MLADALRAAGHDPIPLVWGRRRAGGRDRRAAIAVGLRRATRRRSGRWLDALDRQAPRCTTRPPWSAGTCTRRTSSTSPGAACHGADDRPPARPTGVALDALPWPDVVVKPAIGASARMTVHTGRLAADDAQQHLDRLLDGEDAVVQPYLPSIADARRAVRRRHRRRADPRRRQATGARRLAGAARARWHGGPRPDDRRAGDGGDGDDHRPRLAPTYARVDLVRGGDGQLLLIEVELIEPELWFDLAPGRGDTRWPRPSPGVT